MTYYIIFSLICSFINVTYLKPTIEEFSVDINKNWKWTLFSFNRTNFFFGPFLLIVMLYNLYWHFENYDN